MKTLFTMKHLCVLLVLAVVVLWACDFDGPASPVGSPAGKVASNTEPDGCFIEWECDLAAATDATFSIFYKDYKFFISGKTVEINQYIDSNVRQVYQADREQAFFQSTDSQCGLWSSVIDDATKAPVIFKGDVRWIYRSLPEHSAYWLYIGDDRFEVAKVDADTMLTYVDYSDLSRRNEPKPPLPDGVVSYFPVAEGTGLFRCEDDESRAARSVVGQSSTGNGDGDEPESRAARSSTGDNTREPTHDIPSGEAEANCGYIDPINGHVWYYWIGGWNWEPAFVNMGGFKKAGRKLVWGRKYGRHCGFESTITCDKHGFWGCLEATETNCKASGGRWIGGESCVPMSVPSDCTSLIKSSVPWECNSERKMDMDAEYCSETFGGHWRGSTCYSSATAGTPAGIEPP